MRYQSIAIWPQPEQGGPSLGNTDNASTDTHDTQEEALAVCRMLTRWGFGGCGRIFPLSTSVRPIVTNAAEAAEALGELPPGALPCEREAIVQQAIDAALADAEASHDRPRDDE